MSPLTYTSLHQEDIFHGLRRSGGVRGRTVEEAEIIDVIQTIAEIPGMQYDARGKRVQMSIRDRARIY